MKKLIFVSLLMVMIIVLLICINTFGKDIIKVFFSQTDQDKSIESSPELISWIGNYSFSEYAPPNQNMFYGISIYKKSGIYYAEIGIDGFQTLTRLQAKVEGDKNLIRLVFDKYLPDNLFKPYNRGDILLSFEKRDSNIYTSWGELEPMLLSNQSENIYFKIINK